MIYYTNMNILYMTIYFVSNGPIRNLK